MTLLAMDVVLTTSNIILAILAIIGVIFGVYSHFRNPTEALEKNQISTDKEVNTKATILAQQTMEGKATLLAQQVEWEKIANEKKFADFGLRLDNSMLLASNHIHTVDVKVDKLTESVHTMSIAVATLGCIIEERIPRKTN